MRPLEGVVVECGAELTIRLESGARIQSPRYKDLCLGDTCFVLFDYTRLLVRGIWTEDDYDYPGNVAGHEPKIETPPDQETPWELALLSEPVPDVSL